MNKLKISEKISNPQFGLLLILMAMLMCSIPAFSQTTDKTMNEKKFETYQDNYYKIAAMQNKYPNMVLTYNYDKNGKLNSVSIKGVDNDKDRDNLAVWLMDFHQLADDLLYAKDNNGIYYQAEDNARPADGKCEFYRKLESDINYPEDAKDIGAEGVVDLKFTVDDNGNIHNLQAMNKIKAPKYIANELDKEAMAALKMTNEKWKPAEIDHDNVPEWIVLPIYFKLEPNPGLEPFIG